MPIEAPRGSPISEVGSSPVKPGSSTMKAPNGAIFSTVPVTRVPSEYFDSTPSQGLPVAVSRSDSETRRRIGSSSRIQPSIVAPGWSASSSGFMPCLSCDGWSSPSTPGASSTNQPNSVLRSTLPEKRPPAAQLCEEPCQGSGSSALIESETRSLPLPSLITLAWTCWPTCSASWAWATRPWRISETCTSPSMPPMSTKAPKSARATTRPSTMAPTSSCARISSACRRRSSRSIAVRDRISRCPFSSTRRTRKT